MEYKKKRREWMSIEGHVVGAAHDELNTLPSTTSNDLDGDAKDRAQKGRGRVMSLKRKPYQTLVTGSTLLPVSTGKDLL